MKQYQMGFAIMDFLSDDVNVRFGEFNPRPLVSAQVSKIQKSFREGIDITREPIPILVHQADVAAESITEMNLGTDCQLLTFTKKAADVIACGGRHRTEAMRRMRTDAEDAITGEGRIVKKIEALDKRREKMYAARDKAKGDGKEKENAKIATADETIDELQAKLEEAKVAKDMGKWMVVVYNYGTSPHSAIFASLYRFETDDFRRHDERVRETGEVRRASVRK